MNNPLDSVRPTTQAELPALAHVTSRDERRRKDAARKLEKKKRRQKDQSPEEGSQDESTLPHDDSTGSIDLLA